MAGIETTLRTVRDVQGVYGSFVVSETGALVASDLPAAFDRELFEDVAPRVVRLYETFLSGSEELDACMLRFSEHRVYLRRMTWGVLAVLSGLGVNMPALRMVANLVIRKIDPEVVPLVRPTLAPGSLAAAPLDPSRSSAPPPVATTSSFPPQVRAFERTSPVPSDSVPPPSDAPTSTGANRPVPARMYRGRPVVDDEP